MTVFVVSLALAVVVAGIAVFVFLGARKAQTPVETRVRPKVVPLADPLGSAATETTGPVEVLAPAAPALFDLDLDAAGDGAAPSEIRWSQQFDPRSGPLDDTARLRLIGDLGVVAKEWCVPLLCRAYEEEQRPANRQAALISLAACRSRAAIPTYRRAMTSGDSAESAIAADALADLEPPTRAKPRTYVERR